jgi:hypothetical protein
LPRPGVPQTDEANLHLSVDGQRADGVPYPGGQHIFRLPKSPTCIRIVSRAGVPQELGVARDARQLGVVVSRVVIRQGSRLRLVDADDPVLVDGFHAHEPEGGFRWTDGDAAVPTALFAGFSEPFELVLYVGCTARYPADGVTRRAA